ncbi:hypothetical protein H4219_006262 [Mycoemilia scoparia]|uniref:Uncharacterized protein n=1 Tax=Mycoemilia scoparia TaxID=417184 RepID=A0A9W7ZIV3_9FUNG|nr:hypothetical protein H4219_006262 [Mycoemilia scoparia]
MERSSEQGNTPPQPQHGHGSGERPGNHHNSDDDAIFFRFFGVDTSQPRSSTLDRSNALPHRTAPIDRGLGLMLGLVAEMAGIVNMPSSSNAQNSPRPRQSPFVDRSSNVNRHLHGVPNFRSGSAPYLRFPNNSVQSGSIPLRPPGPGSAQGGSIPLRPPGPGSAQGGSIPLRPPGPGSAQGGFIPLNDTIHITITSVPLGESSRLPRNEQNRTVIIDIREQQRQQYQGINPLSPRNPDSTEHDGMQGLVEVILQHILSQQFPF